MNEQYINLFLLVGINVLFIIISYVFLAYKVSGQPKMGLGKHVGVFTCPINLIGLANTFFTFIPLCLFYVIIFF